MEALLITVSMLGLRLSILQALLHVVDGAYYRLLDKKGTYVQGRQVCQANCLDLAKVTSKQDLEEMNAYFNKTEGRLAFLGAHYNGTSFNWADGEPMLVTKWATNHPKHPDTKTVCGHQASVQSDDLLNDDMDSGRNISATPTHSMEQISHVTCAEQCLRLKTCTHFLLDGTRCQLYNDESTNRIMNTENMEV